MDTVFFRAFEPGDAVLIHQWRNDHQLMMMAVGMPRYSSFQEDTKWVTDRMNHDPYNVYWAICSNRDQRMIGYTSINHIHYINSSAEGGAIVIGDKEYKDGMAWLETYLFVLYYVFEVLHLNRFSGDFLDMHNTSFFASKLFFMQVEGRLRQAAYKDNKYHDLVCTAIIRDEYLDHKKCGDFEMASILKRLRQLKKGNNT